MSRLRSTRLVALVLALVVVAGACSSDPPTVIVSGNNPNTSAKDIVETLEAEGFTVMAALIEEAGLTDLLSDPDAGLTVLAPSDDAFAALAPGLVELLGGEDDVVAPPAATPAATADDSTDDGATSDDDATADEAGVDETEGETAATEEGTDTGAEGEGTEGEATEGEDAEATAAPVAAVATPVLADRPPRAEIQALLADILRNHVIEGSFLVDDLVDAGDLDSIEGSGLEFAIRQEPPATDDGEPTPVPTVDDTDISTTDLRATNGVVHGIDSVLVPDDRQADLDELAASIWVTTDVMSTLASTGEHTLLIDALVQTGLDETLTSAAAVTLFAPSAEAFAQLSAAERAALAQPDVLESVLNFHVLGRTVATTDVANQTSIRTLEGQPILFVKSGDEFSVEGVVIGESIVTTNGVIHIIDALLVPDSAVGPGGFTR